MQKYLAEFVGTMFLVLVVLSSSNPLVIGAGLAIAAMVTGKVSGGHLNPAISVVMSVAKKMPSNDLLPYIVAQVAGGYLMPLARALNYVQTRGAMAFGHVCLVYYLHKNGMHPASIGGGLAGATSARK